MFALVICIIDWRSILDGCELVIVGCLNFLVAFVLLLCKSSSLFILVVLVNLVFDFPVGLSFVFCFRFAWALFVVFVACLLGFVY